MEAGLGVSLPPEANPSAFYTGNPFVKVTQARSQIYKGKSMKLTALIMAPPATATLYYRPLGEGSFQSKSLSHVARSVYEITIPAQQDDFEYYIQAETAIGNATYPVTAPEINQTVVVGPGVTTRISSDDILKKFTLHQNYPNPFNPTTTIRYELPRASDVELVIYDILGRKVVQLVDKRQRAGSRKINWDGKNSFGNNVATGMYIYRIIARTHPKGQVYKKARKMILLK
jgi:hypothetical protein